MINKEVWSKIAGAWTTHTDGLIIPDDKEEEKKKVAGIDADDIGMFGNVSSEEIDDILSDLF